MPRTRIYPSDPAALPERGVNRPETDIESLMQAAPGEAEAASVESRLELQELMADAIDALSERDRWIIEALFWRRLTLRQLGAELAISKTQVARLRDEALQKLGVILIEIGMDVDTIRRLITLGADSSNSTGGTT